MPKLINLPCHPTQQRPRQNPGPGHRDKKKMRRRSGEFGFRLELIGFWWFGDTRAWKVSGLRRPERRVKGCRVVAWLRRLGFRVMPETWPHRKPFSEQCHGFLQRRNKSQDLDPQSILNQKSAWSLDFGSSASVCGRQNCNQPLLRVHGVGHEKETLIKKQRLDGNKLGAT